MQYCSIFIPRHPSSLIWKQRVPTVSVFQVSALSLWSGYVVVVPVFDEEVLENEAHQLFSPIETFCVHLNISLWVTKVWQISQLLLIQLGPATHQAQVHLWVVILLFVFTYKDSTIDSNLDTVNIIGCSTPTIRENVNRETTPTPTYPFSVLECSSPSSSASGSCSLSGTNATKRTSEWWSYFSVKKGLNGLDRVFCNFCNVSYKLPATANMAKHMKEVHPLKIKQSAIQTTLFANNKELEVVKVYRWADNLFFC